VSPKMTAGRRRTSRSGFVLHTLLLTVCVLAATSGSALGATLSFTGAFSSDWNLAANWTDTADDTLHAVPTATDDARIPLGAASVLAAGADGAVRSIAVEPGASLSVTGRTLAVGGDVPSTFGGAVSLTGAATLTLDGESTWSGGNWSLDGSTVSNAGVLTITGDVTAARVNAASTVTNSGTITRDDATPDSGAAVFTTRVVNDGILSVASGSADLRGGGAHAGALSIARGALLAASGTHAVAEGGTVTGAGTLRLDAGTFRVSSVAAEFAPGTLLLSGGFLDLALDSTVDRLTSDGEGGGRRGSSNLLTAGGPTLLNNVTFETSATTLTGPAVTVRQVALSGAVVTLGAAAKTLWDSGTWDMFASRIENAGDLLITGDTTVVNRVSSTVENTGTITRDDAAAGGVASIRAGLLNDGDVNVIAGELQLGGSAPDTSGGTFTVDAPAVLSVTGAPALAGKGDITGTGTVRLDAGTLAVPPGPGLFDPATVVFSGGFLNLGRNATIGRLTSDGQGGGRATGIGTLTAGGPTMFDNVLLFAGTTNLTGPEITLRDLTATGSRLNLEPAAQAVWDAGDWLLSDATVFNRGELRITGDGAAVDAGDPPLVRNTGTLIRDDADPSDGVASITAPLRNSGVLQVANGTLDLGASGEQDAGRTVVDAGAVLGGAGSHYTVTGGRMEGSGTVAGALENAAGVVGAGASPGLLSVDGDYIQGADGTLEAEIAGEVPATDYDQISVSGAVSLGGVLDIVTSADFAPQLGSVYDVVLAGTVAGTFTTINGAELADRTYDVEYSSDPGRVRLSIPSDPPAPPAGGTPSIPEAAQSGDSVSCDPGVWSGEPTAFAYEWLRNGVPIDGANSRKYTLTADDVEQAISCRVVASNAGGASDPATSNEVVPTAPPPPPPPAPENLTAPTIPARAHTGDLLHCAPGSWNGQPTFAFAWLRENTAIATGPDYTITTEDVGHALRCRVSATNDGGTTTALSNELTPTTPPPPPPPPPVVAAPTNLRPPVVVGTPAKGRILRCDPGAWTGSPSLEYRWLLDGALLSDRTDTYRVRGRDVGHALACRVTARNAGGVATATSASAPSALAPGELGLPSAGNCVGPRRLRLRLRAPRPARVKTVGVYVDGHRRVAVPGRALPTVVWVSRLPRKRFELSVRAVDRDGSWRYAAQTYQRCDDAAPARAARRGTRVALPLAYVPVEGVGGDHCRKCLDEHVVPSAHGYTSCSATARPRSFTAMRICRESASSVYER
jgi:hypothetical protein